MRNFQDNFKTCKLSFIIAFSICMAVPLQKYWIKINKNEILLHISSHFFKIIFQIFYTVNRIEKNLGKWSGTSNLFISFYISFYLELLKISVVKKIYHQDLKKWFALASVMVVETVLNKIIKYVPNVFPKTVFPVCSNG